MSGNIALEIKWSAVIN